MVAAGGRRRTAGVGGLVAAAVASTLVNGPIKLVFRRERPSHSRDEGRRQLVRRPRTSSFPSGHAATAFAFATGAALEAPELTLPLAALASGVAHSRVYARVHHRGDVVAGSLVGVGVAVATRFAVDQARATAHGRRVAAAASTGNIPTSAVLVLSPHAGRSARLDLARRALRSEGIDVVAELPVQEVSRLHAVITESGASAPLVIAAGGDGTVGAVADQLAGRDLVLGVLPLGTSNDFARSLGIPTDVARAAALLRGGKIASVDLGQVTPQGGRAVHFAHAATVGLNVSFAKLATRASLRKRLGRLTYIVAAALALQHRAHFDCTLSLDGRTERMRLTQLSVINAPVFGGFLGMRVAGSSADDRLLDVLAVEVVPFYRLMLAGLYAVGKVRRSVKGIRPYHVQELRVHSDTPLELSLDGEVCGALPADFAVAGEALRVVTPPAFDDLDDIGR